MYNYLVKFFRNVTMSFFTAIFVIALAGVTCRDGIMKVSSFYVQGGISFSAVFELLLLSSLLALCNLLLDKPTVFPAMRLTYKIILRIAVVVMLILPFIYVCRWFPVDDHAAWIGFVVCFLLSFSAATLLSVYATRRKYREYQKLLEAYKAKKEERKK